METKFTPGPWAVDVDPERCVILQPGYMAWHIAYSAGAFDREQEEANANLIAAAPELYEALEDVLWAIGNMAAALTAKGVEGTLTDPTPKMRAALAKARGEA